MNWETSVTLRHTSALSLGNSPLPVNNPLLSVIPSVGWALGPPKVMKNFTGNYFLWSRFHFLVIPTGAKRSGGTCGSADPSLRCFSTERSASQIYHVNSAQYAESKDLRATYPAHAVR